MHRLSFKVPRRAAYSNCASCRDSRRENGLRASYKGRKASSRSLPPRGAMPAIRLRTSSSNGGPCASRCTVSPSSAAPAIPHGEDTAVSKKQFPDVDQRRPLRFSPPNPNLLTGLGSRTHESATATRRFAVERWSLAARRHALRLEKPDVRRREETRPLPMASCAG